MVTTFTYKLSLVRIDARNFELSLLASLGRRFKTADFTVRRKLDKLRWCSQTRATRLEVGQLMWPNTVPFHMLLWFPIIGENVIKSFLCYRKQRVKLNGFYSDWAEVLSGIPQGTPGTNFVYFAALLP